MVSVLLWAPPLASLLTPWARGCPEGSGRAPLPFGIKINKIGQKNKLKRHSFEKPAFRGWCGFVGWVFYWCVGRVCFGGEWHEVALRCVWRGWAFERRKGRREEEKKERRRSGVRGRRPRRLDFKNAFLDRFRSSLGALVVVFELYSPRSSSG